MSKLKDLDNKAAEKGKGLETFWQFVKFIFVSLLAMIVQFTLLNTLKFIPPIHKMFDEAQSSAQIVVADKEKDIHSTEQLAGLKVGLISAFEGDLRGVDQETFGEVVVYKDGAAATEALVNGEVDCAIIDTETVHDEKKSLKDYSQYQLESEQDYRWLFFFYEASLGGFAYFIIFNISNIVAQIVSFFVNREKTFNSGANVAITLPIYFIFTIGLITLSAYLNPIFKQWILGFHTTDLFATNAATMACSALQFFLYFPVDKILFHKKKEAPQTEEAAKLTEPRSK